MSITLFQKTDGDLSGEIRIDKDSVLYHVAIYFHGGRIYENWFSTMESAKRALARNMKKYQ